MEKGRKNQPHSTTLFAERRQFELHAVHTVDAVNKEDEDKYECYL